MRLEAGGGGVPRKWNMMARTLSSPFRSAAVRRGPPAGLLRCGAGARCKSVVAASALSEAQAPSPSSSPVPSKSAFVKDLHSRQLLGLGLADLEAKVIGLGAKKFRGKQVYQHLVQGVDSIDGMTSLSKDFREKLKVEGRLEASEGPPPRSARPAGPRVSAFAAD